MAQRRGPKLLGIMNQDIIGDLVSDEQFDGKLQRAALPFGEAVDFLSRKLPVQTVTVNLPKTRC
jgi:hypothetical protein